MTASLPVPTEPTAGLVSLRRFAALVPMKETTARHWREAGRIRATRTATGHYRVPVDQLDDVRRQLGLLAASEPAPEAAPASEPEGRP